VPRGLALKPEPDVADGGRAGREEPSRQVIRDVRTPGLIFGPVIMPARRDASRPFSA